MLTFRYGVMGSSKTANALILEYQCRTKGLNVILVKPDTDTRDGKDIIKSRIGLERKCVLMSELLKKKSFADIDKIIVDEAQFLSEKEVEWLAKMSDKHDIDVICFGLKTDFRTKFFPGSKRLMELADRLEEIENTCWCGEKAVVNARVKDGHVCYDGQQVVLGGDELYVALCRKHYYEDKVGKK